MAETGVGISKDREEGGETERIIRFEIAEAWSAQNLVDFIKAVNDLYLFVLYGYYLYKKSDEGSNPYASWEFVYFKRLISGSDSFSDGLQIKKLRYSSPGEIDFLGLGAIVGHIKDYLLRIKEIKLQKRKRELEDKLLEEEIESKRNDNERQKIENQLQIEKLEAEKLSNQYKNQEFQDAESKRRLELERLEIENLRLKDQNEKLWKRGHDVEMDRWREEAKLFEDNIIRLIEILGSNTLTYLDSYDVKEFLKTKQKEIGELIANGQIIDIRFLSKDTEN